MPDVFLSYSRRDAEFVQRLATALEARGQDVWVDVEGIEAGELFPAALRTAIEGSDALVFVISPDSASSAYCAEEVAHAEALQKRIFPVLARPVEDDALPPGLRDRNWVLFDRPEAFDASVERLLTALGTDQEHVRRHTRLGVRALEWEAAGNDGGLLLRGAELSAAENWLAGATTGVEPEPTELQRAYVLAGRRGAARRGRILAGSAIGVAVVSLVLLVFALVSRHEATTQRVTARAQALSAVAVDNLEEDPQVSLELGVAAVREQPRRQSLYALRAALDASALQTDTPAPKGLAARCYGGFVGQDVVHVKAHADPVVARCDGVVRAGEAHRRVAEQLLGWAAAAKDGSSVAVAAKGRLLFLDPVTFAVIRTVRLAGSPLPMDYSPDGRTLAVVVLPAGQFYGTGSVAQVSVATGRVRPLLAAPRYASARYVAGGRQLLAVDDASVITVADATTGAVRHRLQIGGQAAYGNSIATSPDGRILAVTLATKAGQANVDLWSMRTWRRLRTAYSGPDAVTAIAFGPDSSRLALGTSSGAGGIWSIGVHDRLLMTFSAGSTAVIDVSFTRDGQQLVTSDGNGVLRTWRATGPQTATAPVGFRPSGQNAGLAITGDRLVALGATGVGQDGELEFFDAAGRPAGTQTLPRGVLPQPYNGAPFLPPQNTAVLSGDGRAILVAQGARADPRLRVLAVPGGRTLATLPSLPYSYAAFAPGNRAVLLYGAKSSATARSGPGFVARLDGSPAVRLRTDSKQPFDWALVIDARFAPDGRTVVGLTDELLTVWDAATGRVLRSLRLGGGAVDASLLNVAPGSRTVAIATGNGQVQIRDLRTGRLIHALIGHGGYTNFVSYTPDGRFIVSVSDDQTARVWDPRTGRELRRYDLGAPPNALAMGPGGRTFVVSDTDGTIRIFDTCTACGDGDALLKLAAARDRPTLTVKERSAIDDALRP